MVTALQWRQHRKQLTPLSIREIFLSVHEPSLCSVSYLSLKKGLSKDKACVFVLLPPWQRPFAVFGTIRPGLCGLVSISRSHYIRHVHECGLRTLCLQPRVSHFCLNGTSGFTTCNETTESQIIAYAKGLARCFKTAIDKGVDIAVTPHLKGQGTIDLETLCRRI